MQPQGLPEPQAGTVGSTTGGRSRRSGGREEILGGSLHGIRHHRFDDGPGRCFLERVLPKGPARPDDDGLNGLASALGNRGIRPKINIKRRAGMVGGHLDRLKGRSRPGGSRFQLHRRRRLVAQRIVHGSRFRFAFHFLGHLVAPAEHTGQPPGHRNAAGRIFLIGTVIVIAAGSSVQYSSSACRAARRSARRAAFCS